MNPSANDILSLSRTLSSLVKERPHNHRFDTKYDRFDIFSNGLASSSHSILAQELQAFRGPFLNAKFDTLIFEMLFKVCMVESSTIADDVALEEDSIMEETHDIEDVISLEVESLFETALVEAYDLEGLRTKRQI